MMVKNKSFNSFNEKSILKKYAPLWTILLSVTTTLIQVVGTRYIKERELKFTIEDFKSAFIKSVIGYFGFGSKYKKA